MKAGTAAAASGEFRRWDGLVRHVKERKVLYSGLCFALFMLLAVIWHRYTHFTHLLRLGQNVFPHQPGPCHNLAGVASGAEDLELFTAGLVFISTGLRFNIDPDAPSWKERIGQILLFDFNKSTNGANALMIEGKIHRRQFNPHGLGSWANNDGTFSLFVVNHQDEQSVVERFTYNLLKPNVLRHDETIRSHSFHLLSDVVATGPRSFYYTNAFKNRGHGTLLQKMEMYFSMGLGTIGHCMRQSCGKVVDGLRIPSGIAMSPDKKLVYLSHLGAEAVEVFEIVEHHALQEKQSWPVDTAISNINVDPVSGDLWTGGTSMFYRTFHHNQDPALPCPSQVLHFKTRDGVITKMREVYAEDGNRFVSLSSSAIVHRNKLLIGSAFTKAAMCDVLYGG